ncbi:MAG: hypothetical protein FRX49_12443 [Trebouxia sp. A1-2]|nr:MAG: hypothetical protein FRX49_12443 [Trebouxia sp. A1-2]
MSTRGDLDEAVRLTILVTLLEWLLYGHPQLTRGSTAMGAVPGRLLGRKPFAPPKLGNAPALFMGASVLPRKLADIGINRTV